MHNYDSTNKRHIFLQERINRYHFASKFVKDKLVLDAACGTGYGSLYLAGKAKFVIGCDISRKAILRAKSKAKMINNCDFIVCDCQALPLRSNTFGVVVSLETIEHIDNYLLYI